MKKVLALVLAVVLCMGLGTMAFAVTAADENNIPDVIAYVKVVKTAANGDDPAVYFKADDLKASIEWDDGKAQFDKVELEDVKYQDGATPAVPGVYKTDDISVVADAGDGGKTISVVGKTANLAATDTTLDKQLDKWVATNKDDADYSGWTITHTAGEAFVKATASASNPTAAAPTGFSNKITQGVAAVGGTAAECIKVTVSFKEYYGTKEVEIGGDLQLKKGNSPKAMTYVATPSGEDAATAASGDLSEDGKKLSFVNNFEWDKLDEQQDKDDDTVTVDITTGAVVFNDEDAKFTTFEFANVDALSVAGKMSKQGKVNMYLDVAVTDEIKSLMKKNEKVDFDVLNFVGKPEFDFTQEVTYYIDDEDVTYYVYEIKDGKATKVNAKLNDDKDALVWKTRVLGTYIVTDAEIDASAATDDDKTEDGDKENPATGASDFVGVAIALGTVSLVAAGAVALKK